MEGQEGVTMERPAFSNARIETNLATESRQCFSVYNNLLIQLPPATNTTFHFLMDGQPDSSDWNINHPPDETIEA